ncbi:MAG: hypothetical protein R3C26_17425 [Calditrichia bacterium]
MDDSFSGCTRQGQQESRLFSVFTIIAIFIACLSIMRWRRLQRRSAQEIGIRKVLGATVRI